MLAALEALEAGKFASLLHPPCWDEL
jgi:hypothetical protein